MDGGDLGFIARIFMWLLKGLKLFCKVAFFVGLGWFLLPMLIAIAYELITGKGSYDNVIIAFLCDGLWYLAYVLCPLTLIQNVVRMVKKDRSFSLIKFALQKKPKQGFVAKLGSDTVALKPASEVSGLVFGKKSGKYVVMTEETDGHALIVGGAGSGKTACLAIPSLMSWKDRVFAIDIKGELYQKTKKARNEAQIKVFDPTDRASYGYDPFCLLKQTTDISSEARSLALSICPLPAELKDPFWVKSSQNMLTGFIVFLFSQGLSFSESMRVIKSQPVKTLVAQIMESGNQKAIAEISQFDGMDDKTLLGVFAELSNHITVFATSEDLQYALSGEGRCITPQDLENGYDVYCCIPEYKLEEWKDLLGMMCNQFLKSFERRGEDKKTPILFLIDEFPRLGKIETISNGLATLRSKKIHIALIVQSKSQLNAIYGKDVAEVIADNCSYKAILKASEPNTQEWCSKLVGTFDKKKISSNYNADMIGIGKGQGSSSSTEEKRIIKPEEFAYLQDVVCVFPNGYHRLEKVFYFKDKHFMDRV